MTCQPGGCLGDGEPCEIAGDCCSLGCFDGLCDEEATCAVEGADCLANAECCSNVCESGTCDKAPTSCSPLGELCSSDGNCCSESCQMTSDGSYRCASLGFPPTANVRALSEK